MKALKPITKEYIRRFSILILLALFAWMFFYTPSDIYKIQVKDYTSNYQEKVKDGSIEASDTSLDDYIRYKMKGAYTWSTTKHNIVKVSGEAEKFLNRIMQFNRGDLFDNNINEHRSPNTSWSGDSYFFRSDELPKNFLSQTYAIHPDYITSKGMDGQNNYFVLYAAKSTSMLDDAPVFIANPFRSYGYILLVLSILIYIMIPKPQIPQGAAYYTRFNAVYLADILGIFLWTGAWMFFFLPGDSAPVFVRYFFLSFFAIFALAIVLPTIKYASNWYLFTENTFSYSDTDGLGKVPLHDIVSIKPYKRQLPKWVAVLIVLFGRGNVGATGIGSLAASSTPEIGMEITTKSGKKIKVMANYLEADEVFTEHFQKLENNLESKSNHDKK